MSQLRFEDLAYLEKGDSFILYMVNTESHEITLEGLDMNQGLVTGYNKAGQYMLIHKGAVKSISLSSKSSLKNKLMPEAEIQFPPGEMLQTMTFEVITLEPTTIYIHYLESVIPIYIKGNVKIKQRVVLSQEITGEQLYMTTSNPVIITDLKHNSEKPDLLQSGDLYCIPVKPDLEACSMSVQMSDYGQGAYVQLYLDGKPYDHEVKVPKNNNKYTWLFPPQKLSGLFIKVLRASASIHTI